MGDPKYAVKPRFQSIKEEVLESGLISPDIFEKNVVATEFPSSSLHGNCGLVHFRTAITT